MRYYVDLAQKLPSDLMAELGEITVLFGRLEHMVLLAIKRKRNISLEEANKLYGRYTLGSKVSGKIPCRGSNEFCLNFGGEPGLRQLAVEDLELKKICIEINELTAERNKLMHGLITTVDDYEVIAHKNKLFEFTEEKLWKLKDNISNVIVRLNEAVPVSGLTASWGSPAFLDLVYDKKALDPNDPIVKKYSGDF